MTKKARQQLDLYNAKRDFSKTAEPSGKVAAPAAQDGRLRFVVQKHAARRLHYDFRLELNGVMKSWAVTRGPSIDPADKRLAVEVEDHPLAYGDFEGTIPTGEYGGGTVQLWDRGYWQPEGSRSPEASLKAGELKFKLFGTRLNGSWVLVRMRKSEGKRVNWLLIKHRDAQAGKTASAAQQKREQQAATALLALDASIASGRSMAQIAAGKGAKPKPFIAKTITTNTTPRASRKRAARTTRVAAKALQPSRDVVVDEPQRKVRRVKHLPQFIEPALCKLMSEAPNGDDGGDDWLHEIKLDGYRLQLRVANKQAVLRTRKGLDWTDKFQHIADAAQTLPPCIIDGEVVALDKHGTPSFAALQAALSDNDSSKLTFYVFDLLFLNDEDLRPLPLLERKQRLQQLLITAGNPAPLRYVDHVTGDGNQVLQAACRMHLEGLISKRANASYASGRDDRWIKTKCRAGHEVVIGGMTTEAGRLRSLLVGVMRAGKLVYVGRVGTGFGATTSGMVLPKLKALISKTNPFHGATAPRQESNVTWLKPELVAEIEFAGWTGGGNVRQAAFKGLRQDKPAAEVKAEVPATPKRNNAAKNLVDKVEQTTRSSARKRTSPQQDKNDSTQVDLARITNATKVLWPKGTTAAVNKLQLAQYYQQVAEWMLPHVQGRPCSIVRAPDGINGQHFFQRHAMRSAAGNLHTIKLAGDHQPYLMIDSHEALLGVAQLGALELHPGNGIPDAPETPGRLVFDLDPAPEVAFDAVIDAALELRDRLQQIGMTSFCKTTGGKGLHVVVPLSVSKAKSNHLDWRTAKLFSQTLCAQMVGDHPQRYLINMSKAQRKGKIFLDYLRNDRLATAVAPLSPRARSGAPVSMPLLWTQVRRGLDPARFTVHSAWALLQKQRPWQEYAQSGNSLTAAMKVLLKQHRHAA